MSFNVSVVRTPCEAALQVLLKPEFGQRVKLGVPLWSSAHLIGTAASFLAVGIDAARHAFGCKVSCSDFAYPYCGHLIRWTRPIAKSSLQARVPCVRASHLEYCKSGPSSQGSPLSHLGAENSRWKMSAQIMLTEIPIIAVGAV